MMLYSFIAALLMLLSSNASADSDENGHQFNEIHDDLVQKAIDDFNPVQLVSPGGAQQFGYFWQLKQDAGKYGIQELKFQYTFKYAEPMTMWFLASQFGFFGPDHPKAESVYCGLQPQDKTKDGKVLMRALFSSFIANSTVESPNCHDGADYMPGVSCAMLVEAKYDSHYTILINKVPDTKNSWQGILSVEGKEYQIGQFSLPEQFTGMANSNAGFLENFLGHKGCKVFIPFFADFWPAEANGEIAMVTGSEDRYRCPNQPPSYIFQYADGHYAYFAQ